MNLSAFEIIGPVMIGPSSSHTAGAVRLSLVGRGLLGCSPTRAVIGLHGSFAATGRGHGTDRALLAGLLGFDPAAEELANAHEHARAGGLSYAFEAVDLGDQVHPNTVQLQISAPGAAVRLTGASVGGGAILIEEVDGLSARFSCSRPTLVCWHHDRRGFLCEMTGLLAKAGLNIATISTARQSRGAGALTVVETDEPLTSECSEDLPHLVGLRRFRELSSFA